GLHIRGASVAFESACRMALQEVPMRASLPLVLALLLAPPLTFAQNAAQPVQPPQPTRPVNPATPPSHGASVNPANPAAAPAPVQPNAAALPVQPASDAGATERGMTPVQPGALGVTRRVQNANTHDVDATGHTLDPHGKPVGQAPSPGAQPATPSTVH
ncbi:MAG: hypothetical protein ABWX83_06840, partial [Luteibacter sp.]